jgi:uncharacterized protein (DUF2236 family)
MSPVLAEQDKRAAGEAGGEVIRKVNREVIVLLGWGPAILMQFAHPLVAAGVAEHSSFRAGPSERVRRLRQTLDAMLALTFGTPEQAARAARGINAIHDRVHGELSEPGGPFPRGTAYSAHDPELLRWVHATMLDMLPRTYELFIGPLAIEEKDRYCADATGIGPLLGTPDGYLPTSMAQLGEYMSEMLASGEITVTPTARMLARQIVSPDHLGRVGPPAWLNRLVTIGLLPPSIRADYGYRWDRRDELALRLCAGASRRLVPLLPSALRHWPAARRAPPAPARTAGSSRASPVRSRSHPQPGSSA